MSWAARVFFCAEPTLTKVHISGGSDKKEHCKGLGVITLNVFCWFPGSSILLAKMATRKAKPNGQYYLKSEEVLEFMSEQSVQNIPGNTIKPRSHTMMQRFTIAEKLNGHRQDFKSQKVTKQ